MDIKKVNTQGQYCNFPGTTIIAKFKAVDDVFWKKIYQIAYQTEFEQTYYTALPYPSYHMTTIRLFNKAESNSLNWREFIINKQSFFKSLSTYLHEHQFYPEITFNKIGITDTLHIQVAISNQQDLLIQKMAEQFNLTLKIKKPFHITLAYFYKKINLEFKNNLQQQVSENLEKLYSQYGRAFTLNPPELCVYNDMTRFIKWNGEGYPFNH